MSLILGRHFLFNMFTYIYIQLWISCYHFIIINKLEKHLGPWQPYLCVCPVLSYNMSYHTIDITSHNSDKSTALSS